MTVKGRKVKHDNPSKLTINLFILYIEYLCMYISLSYIDVKLVCNKTYIKD